MKPTTDLVCLSHLRWDFVFQRPNHLMTRFARDRRVLFVEEPKFGDCAAHLEHRPIASNLTALVPHLPNGSSQEEASLMQARLLAEMAADQGVRRPVLWFYTPMALPIVSEIQPSLVVYDCMDELSGFRGAPPELVERERELFSRANLVFTGGQSLYEAKTRQHHAVHAFPSSVDASHFARARGSVLEPPDQAAIGGPRVGYFGVIDERLDLALIDQVAGERPDYQFVMIGPVVKIDPAHLPRRPNLHWLGQQSYADLPLYLAGWDVAMMPFALNEATRFISPTKTLEYLAAGRTVVSTAIRDVVTPYGEQGLVRIADASSFARAVDAALSDDLDAHRRRADDMLATTSWDRTFERMSTLVDAAHAGLGSEAAVRQGEASCSTI